MKDSVLSLGETIVLAARLAAIEHVRQELADAQSEPQPEREGPVGDAPAGFTDESEPPTLQALFQRRMTAYFRESVAA